MTKYYILPVFTTTDSKINQFISFFENKNKTHFIIIDVKQL